MSQYNEDEAMLNAYRLITGKYDIDEIIEAGQNGDWDS